MTYRDPLEASRSQVAALEEDLGQEQRKARDLEERLGFAERKLAQYRKSAPSASKTLKPMAYVIAGSIVVLWASSVVSAMRDHDGLATHLAAASAVFSALAPLIAWTADDRLLSGIAALATKLVLSFGLTVTASFRMARHVDSWVMLFWVGPASMLACALFELYILVKSDPK